MAKKGEVRIAGFDCAEEKHRVVLLDAKGKVEKELDIINRRDLVQEGLAKLLLVLPEGTKLVVVVESRRSHGRIVSEVADQLGCEVWVVNSVALNHYRPVEGQPHKTDPCIGARGNFLNFLDLLRAEFGVHSPFPR